LLSSTRGYTVKKIRFWQKSEAAQTDNLEVVDYYLRLRVFRHSYRGICHSYRGMDLPYDGSA
jgi:hypothetical protein